MELNGAFPTLKRPLRSRVFVSVGIRLVKKAVESPRSLTPIPARTPPVSEIVSRVLADAVRPMRACEVHRAAELLFGAPLRWKSVKAALTAGVGESGRFERVGYGVYRSVAG